MTSARVLLPSLALLLAAVPAFAAQVDLSAEDQAAIRAAALDYAEGWYAGDRERMARSLHDTLAKRAWLPDREGGRRLDEVGKEALLARNAPANRERYAAAPKRAEVEILDGFGHAATVKLAMDGWVDYMHFADVPGEGWKIVNVLWELESAR